MIKVTFEASSKSKKLLRKKKILQTVLKYKLKGYPYKSAKRWGQKIYYDLNTDNGKTIEEKKWAHKRGFLSSSIDKYDLTEENYKNFLSDFEYTFITPLNSSYEKWLTDRLTPYYIMHPYRNMFPEVYYNVIRRNGKQKIISIMDNGKVVTLDVVINLLKNKNKLLLLPSQVSHFKYSYLLEYREDDFYVNNVKISTTGIEALFGNIKSYYVIRAYSDTVDEIKEIFDGREIIFKFILANNNETQAEILSAYAENERPYIGGRNTQKRFKNKNLRHIIIDESTGRVEWKKDGRVVDKFIPGWSEICEKVTEMATFLFEIDYMMLAVKVTANGIKLVGHGRMPKMPEGTKVDSRLNRFLKEKSRIQKDSKIRKQSFKAASKERILNYLRKNKFRKGFRSYMVGVWLELVWDDIKGKGVSLKEKIWAWKRGFLSYRIEQYGLTEDNWKNFLSDYDYAWLNRLNNTYQKWINDKTTMRYVLEPLKEYIPEYYYFIGKRNGKPFLRSLPDCPENMPNSFDGILKLLECKSKLVFKPNAGLHGDGFYKIEQYDKDIYVNNEKISLDNLRTLIYGQRSTYVITDYIEMHKELKKIYGKSVNTIRIMVLNESCDNPIISQTYMRVGTTKTGVTDNVAFGGIAVHVNRDTGYYDKAELLKNHKYIEIEAHPDTGTVLKGYLPNWELVKHGVIKVSKALPQLEYLGYDIAITDDGFKILEINIHQDIHKAHEYSTEVNEFFKRKIEYKKKIYGIY